MKQKVPYIPKEFPPKSIKWDSIISRIGEANRGIALFEGFLRSLINPEIFLSPLTTNEAVLSSRIEGTQATFEDVMKLEAGVISPDTSESIKQDVQEIINYRNALQYAEEELNHRTISLSLIKEIHKILLSSVRGEDRLLGEFRKTQNWIGPAGTPIENARFIPPEPMVLHGYLEQWEKFLKEDNFPDKLVQLALVHAQFEILHPFEDGNGRTGRILLPMFLYWSKLLSKPTFYLSEFFEENRAEYYDRLLYITEKDDWQDWVEFFLRAVIEQSKRNISKANKLIDLYNTSKQNFIEATQSQYAIPALDAFFKKPIIDTATFISLTHMPKRSSASDVLDKLINSKLIKLYKPSKGKRAAVYIFCELLNTVEDKKIC